MENFLKKINIIAEDTNKYLKKIFHQKTKYSHLIKPMKYSVFSGGKRFRSSIIVNTGKIFDINYKKLIIISSAVECVHSYSLIHDDLPAMDNDNLRRGKLSTHKKFNEFTAILAGNSLLTLAFEILSSKSLKLSSKTKNELILLLATYSGFSGLAAGQYFDLTFENKKISMNKVIDIQYNKTGKLFAFCCECIGIIKNQNLKKRKILRDIGLDIGLLFQVTDDLIDFKGDSKVVGKPTKRDKNKGKPTLVNLIGYKKTLNFAYNLKKKLNNKIKKYGNKSHDLLQSIEFILDRKF
ncbi:polyprenyl synthetase family protein [Pelagibacteraceae bacterium]|nr:polyprenyl synthetase family protein [Pelagibacteraceae bacterium]